MRKLLSCLLCVGVLAFSNGPAQADRVTPSDRVTNHVTIRAAATSNSADLGSLSPGETLPFVGNVPRCGACQRL